MSKHQKVEEEIKSTTDTVLLMTQESVMHLPQNDFHELQYNILQLY